MSVIGSDRVSYFIIEKHAGSASTAGCVWPVWLAASQMSFIQFGWLLLRRTGHYQWQPKLLLLYPVFPQCTHKSLFYLWQAAKHQALCIGSFWLTEYGYRLRNRPSCLCPEAQRQNQISLQSNLPLGFIPTIILSMLQWMVSV